MILATATLRSTVTPEDAQYLRKDVDLKPPSPSARIEVVMKSLGAVCAFRSASTRVRHSHIMCGALDLLFIGNTQTFRDHLSHTTSAYLWPSRDGRRSRSMRSTWTCSAGPRGAPVFPCETLCVGFFAHPPAVQPGHRCDCASRHSSSVKSIPETSSLSRSSFRREYARCPRRQCQRRARFVGSASCVRLRQCSGGGVGLLIFEERSRGSM